MNVVRICFQASYRDQQGHLHRMDPILSEPVYDKSESRVPCSLGLSCHRYGKVPRTVAWMSRASLWGFVCFLFPSCLLHLHGGLVPTVSGELGPHFRSWAHGECHSQTSHLHRKPRLGSALLYACMVCTLSVSVLFLF